MLLKEIVLYCAISSADVVPPAILDCFDSMFKCNEMYGNVLECTKCHTHYNRTICEGYGVSSYD